MILDLFIYIIQFYINQNTFLPGFIIREKNEAEIEELNAKIATAQNEVNQAQTAYDKALNDFNSTMSPLEQAKKNLADFEAKYATELARLNQGSKGYFDSVGCSNLANAVLIEGKLAPYTKVGQIDDATSLENMQASSLI